MAYYSPTPAVGIYPDPTDDEGDADPYPVLRQSNKLLQTAVQNNFNNGQSLTEAQKQYRMLANQLPNGAASANGAADYAAALEGDNEGVPMASSYLNLNPELYETDAGDVTVDESEIEAATDIESMGPAAGSSIPNPGRKGPRRRGWKWALKGTAHDPALNKEHKQKPRGRPPGRKSKKRALDPGHEFKEKQMKATQAFVDGRLDDALRFAREAVQVNPEIFASHSLLSQILEAQGQYQDSLAALLSGAVTARDPNTWVDVAQRTLQYAGEDRSPDVLQQAIFCYTQAIELEKRDQLHFEARVGKMEIWIELGHFPKARRDCKQLVSMRPGDIELVHYLADLSVKSGDSFEIKLARSAYETAFTQTYVEDYDFNEDALAAAWNHLNIYLELVDQTSPAEEAIAILKRFARQFLGRADETFWEKYTADDREVDIDHRRRYLVGEFQQGRATRDLAQYGGALPLELRVKLGQLRLKMDATNRAEALQHFEHLMDYRDEVETFFDMFYAVATNLSARGESEAAIPFYEAIKDLPDVPNDEYWIQYGQCLRNQKQFEAAAKCFENAVELNPLNIEAKLTLARVYQDNLDEKEKAFKIVDEIIAAGRKDMLRREKMSMRPRARNPNNIVKRRQPAQGTRDADSDNSSGDEYNEDGADNDRPDDNFQPVKRIKRRRRGRRGHGVFVAPEGGDAPPEVVEDQSDAADDIDTKVRKNEARLWRAQLREVDKSAGTKQGVNEQKIAALASLAEQVRENYAIVQRLWPQLEHGEEETIVHEWTNAALTLYRIFRSVRQFYPSRDKHLKFRGFLRLEPGEAKFMDEMQAWKKTLEGGTDAADAMNGRDFAEFYANTPKVDDSMPKDFYDVPFSTWHHIFVDLALLYARRSRQAACYQIIDDGLYAASVFFHDPILLNTTQATSLCCGFIFNDSERLCFAARWFLNKQDLRCGSGFQLLSAVNRLSFGSNLWFSAGPTQKHMLRSIKALDYHIFPAPVRRKFDWSLQLPTLKKRVEKFGEDTGHLDANALLTYGHMVGVANHSQSALPYFFRAFALQPENVTINLSIATMYIQNAMKRQTDNRQYGIAQGLSFMYRYYDLRAQHGGALELQEAEFNIGRTWHMLGLTHLAFNPYERALALSDAVEQENSIKRLNGEPGNENFAKEAAIALVNMFAITGNDEAARDIVERWLVL